MKLLLYSSSVGSYCTSIGMFTFMVYIPIFKNSMRRISDGNSKSWRLKRGPQSCVSFMSEIFRTSSVQKELLVSGKKVQRNILNKLRHVSISLKAEVRIMFRKHASTMTMCRFSIDWNSTILFIRLGLGHLFFPDVWGSSSFVKKTPLTKLRNSRSPTPQSSRHLDVTPRPDFFCTR